MCIYIMYTVVPFAPRATNIAIPCATNVVRVVTVLPPVGLLWLAADRVRADENVHGLQDVGHHLQAHLLVFPCFSPALPSIRSAHCTRELFWVFLTGFRTATDRWHVPMVLAALRLRQHPRNAPAVRDH